MGKYFTVEVKPTLPVATQIQSNASDLVYAAGDLLFDWEAFDVPKGANKLIDIAVMVRGAQTVKGLEFYFAESDASGTAPTTAGTGNATADGVGYYDKVIGAVSMDVDNFKSRLDNVMVGTLGQSAGEDNQTNLVLQGVPESGTNVGYDKLYLAVIVKAGSGWNFSTGVLANAAVSSESAATFVTKTVDPRLFFVKGDTVLVHDSDTAIGTVDSLTDNDINLTAVNGVAIAEDDEIMNANPVTVILSFER